MLLTLSPHLQATPVTTSEYFGATDDKLPSIQCFPTTKSHGVFRYFLRATETENSAELGIMPAINLWHELMDYFGMHVYEYTTLHLPSIISTISALTLAYNSRLSRRFSSNKQRKSEAKALNLLDALYFRHIN